jgi:LysR family hydrogen peroxide-inducible transcriptional activator
MNLQQLEYIIAVDQLKSFSKAAAHCKVTQATLSAMVKKLEEELDVVLFDRKLQPILTTDTGRAIIDEARKVIFHTTHLKDLARPAESPIQGNVKIGIIPTIASSLLAIVLKPLLEKYPKLIFEFYEFTTDNIVKQLRDGLIDIAIASTPLNLESIEENILYYEALLIYGNIDPEKEYFLPKELEDQRIWLMEEGHCLRQQVMQLCSLKPKENLPKNLIFEANSFETLLSMVDNFGGLTLIPELYYKTISDGRKQKVRSFASPIPVREVSLIYFRPFAKGRIIEAITKEIREIVNCDLISNQYKKSELTITQI